MRPGWKTCAMFRGNWSTTSWSSFLSITLPSRAAPKPGIRDAGNMASRAGDLLLVPIALAAFWTLAYQLVLVTRLPAKTTVWFFFAFSALGCYHALRLWM